MSPIPREELLGSKKKADNLTKNLTLPKNQWESNVRTLLKLQIIIEDLVSRKVITTKQSNILKNKIKPLNYWNIIHAPHNKNKEELKKEIKILILNNELDRIGFGEEIRVLDC